MHKASRLVLAAILILALLVRIWGIDSTPPSLYWDEMDAGYQAFSILKTGKDYFGNVPGLVVRSFADYRAPLLVYITIPFVAIFGLNSFSVRLPAAIFGMFCVFLVYLLGRILFKSEKIGLAASFLTAFSPWNIQYSRMGFEATLMLSLFLGGLICFISGIKNSKFYILSGILFGLSILSYNTAKLFVPIMVLALILIYIRKKDVAKNFIAGNVILGIIFLLSLYSSFFQGGGQRFSEISVLTDPQIASETDISRNQSGLSYAKNRDTGLSSRFIDQVIYNKATFVLDRVSKNYLTAFSPEFLFINGDPNLRHSPYKIGELYRIEYFTVLLGLGFLFFNLKRGDKGSLLILLWIALAPLPAVITREGGNHATRLFFLFPALSLTSALGVFFFARLLVGKIRSFLLAGLGLIWAFGLVFFLNYYFGAYRIESSKYFQYGFSKAIEKAHTQTGNYDYVIIDDRRDSALMNYLFDTKYSPANFQTQVHKIAYKNDIISGNKVGKIVSANPEIRDWANIFAKNLLNENYLLIVSSEQLEEQTIEKVPDKLTKNQKLLDMIYNLDGSVAFYLIENKKPEAI